MDAIYATTDPYYRVPLWQVEHSMRYGYDVTFEAVRDYVTAHVPVSPGQQGVASVSDLIAVTGEGAQEAADLWLSNTGVPSPEESMVMAYYLSFSGSKVSTPDGYPISSHSFSK